MALAVTLHDIGALLIVDVSNLGPRVGGDALAVEPADVGPADRVLREGAKGLDRECFRGYAWPEAEDSAAGRVGEHGVAEAVDEVRGCGGFPEGCDKVCDLTLLARTSANGEWKISGAYRVDRDLGETLCQIPRRGQRARFSSEEHGRDNLVVAGLGPKIASMLVLKSRLCRPVIMA